jgi:hypothetical protein
VGQYGLYGKKVSIFTAFADTANYLYADLAEERLSLGIQTGLITGKDAPKTTLSLSRKQQRYDFQ